MRKELAVAAAVVFAVCSRAMGADPTAVPANETVRDWRYELSIHDIARADDDRRLEQLLADNPDRAGARLPDGRTALHVAAEAGSLKAIKLLAKAGADLNAMDSRHRTPLSIAVGADYLNTAKALLQAGADPTIAAWSEGSGAEELQPPVIIAARRGNLGLLKAMLTAKAKIDQKGGKGATALTAAADGGYWEVVNFLLDQGANVNGQDGEGATPLLLAAAANDEKEAGILLAHGADPHITDHAGRSVLSVTENPALWKMLVAKGADVDVVVSGATPLQYFIARGNLALVKAWLEYHPDPFVTDRQGHTAKELAWARAARRTNSYEADMERRQIAQMVEAYQKRYAAEQEAAEEAKSPKTPATAPHGG